MAACKHPVTEIVDDPSDAAREIVHCQDCGHEKRRKKSPAVRQ